MDCVILGDSLAVGVGQILNECRTTAKIGINSSTYIAKHPNDFVAEVAVISLGSNDWEKIPTKNNIQTLRSHITARKVYWIIPNIHKWVRYDVITVASSYGDVTIDAHSVPRSRDGIHPTSVGYRRIASEIK